MRFKKLWVIISLGSLFIASVIGGYFYFSKAYPKRIQTKKTVTRVPFKEELVTVRIYYPVGNQLHIEERILQRKNTQLKTAQAIVEEFLKGPIIDEKSHIPKGARVVGMYRDADRILYVELSEEFRRNFQGDALAEYLLIKGLYETLMSNVDDIEDVKVLIEGEEVETLGGHFYLSYPLKSIVSPESD
jgi:spore germination protein GerM